MKDTFLELSPEHGGLRFGPFAGMEIRLGSLPAPRNDITLPEDLGILPEHVKIISQGDGSFVVAPVERSAVVFIWRSGGAPKQIVTPVAIQSSHDIHTADAVSLGSVEGPKFYMLRIEREKVKAKDDTAFKRAKGKLSGKSMLTEIKRQGMTSVLTTKGGAFFQYYWTFVKTGTIFRPRYIIMFFLIGMGWLTSGIVGIFSCSLKSDSNTMQAGLESQKEELDECLGIGESDERSFRTEVARLLATQKGGAINTSIKQNWINSLPKTSEFTKEFKKQFSDIYNDPKEYRRFYRTKSGGEPIRSLRKKLDKLMSTTLSRPLSFTAARDQDTLNRDWYAGKDSNGEQVCLRGPLRLTWRQAVNLNLNGGQVPVDRLVPTDEFDDATSGDKQACKMLNRTVRTMLDLEADTHMSGCPGTWAKEPGYTNSPNSYCLFSTEADVRSVANWDENGITSLDAPDWDGLAKGLASAVNDKNKFPPVGDSFDVVSRLLWIYMADASSTDLFQKLGKQFAIASKEEIDPNGALTAVEGLETVAPWARRRAARALALATAIPCLAVQDSRKKETLKLKKLASNMGMLEDEMPSFIDCIVVNAMSQEP